MKILSNTQARVVQTVLLNIAPPFSISWQDPGGNIHVRVSRPGGVDVQRDGGASEHYESELLFLDAYAFLL